MIHKKCTAALKYFDFQTGVKGSGALLEGREAAPFGYELHIIVLSEVSVYG
jgi:hypothetical protein